MGDEQIDTRLLTGLTVQSQDLNSDAVRITRDALDEFTAGTTAVAGNDVMTLQTAASIENLAVSQVGG